MKSLPLHDRHAQAGARFREEAGLEQVGSYGDLAGEVQAFKQGAGLIDLSDLGRTRIEGRDRIRFLQSMLTNEIASVGPGQGTYALLLTSQGKLVADMHLYAFPEHLLMVQSERVRGPGLAMLDRYLIADKVKFKDIAADTGWLSVQGPEAAAVLKRALPGIELPETLHAHTGFSLEAVQGEVFNADRAGYGGFDLLVPNDGLEPVWAALLEAGATAAGYDALDIVRVERGIPLAGRDMTENTIPLEAGAWVEDRGINHNKGCYIGQEVICRIKARGHVNWMLTALRVDEGVEPGMRLFTPEKDVGWVTSVVESPALGRIGLGYVHRNARRPGERLAAGSMGSSAGVELHEVPLVAPG